jgi:sugar lactone lactonase YvrE
VAIGLVVTIGAMALVGAVIAMCLAVVRHAASKAPTAWTPGVGSPATAPAGTRATAAERISLAGPDGLAIAPDGAIYIADTLNNRIRRVDPTGIISTVAGSSTRP